MKINYKIVSGEVKQIRPNIYAVVIKNDYDRSMLFCRYQEYYESPLPKIRRKFFTLEEFMRLYTIENKKGYFSYPEDWVGYNIPSNILMESEHVFRNNNNLYDEIMSEIINYCISESSYKPWYLISIDKINSSIMNHEIAHGLYYTNPTYKSEMDRLINNIDSKTYCKLKKELIKIGYVNDNKIIDDEIQAYMSTGKLSTWKMEDYEKYSKDFVKVFKKYNKKNENFIP
jgi:hypothetical protein